MNGDPGARRGRLTGRALAAGAILAVLGAVAAGPPFVPLYDGVVPAEPYRYLDPGPGQQGQPQGKTASVAVGSGGNDLVAVATPELVPQAQILVIPGGLALPSGTTRVDVSIAAIEPPAQPADGHIAGNVYAILVANQAGAAIPAKPDAHASIELRAPDETTTSATVERFDGTAWQPVKTDAVGLGGLFAAEVTTFGDFAIVLPGPAGTAGSSASSTTAGPGTAAPGAPTGAPAETPGGGLPRELLTAVLGGAAAVIVVLVAGLALWPSRRAPPGSGGREGRDRARPRR